jgi:hypothetical protein
LLHKKGKVWQGQGCEGAEGDTREVREGGVRARRERREAPQQDTACAIAANQEQASRCSSLIHPPLKLGFAQVEERLHDVLGALVHRPLAHNVPAEQGGRRVAGG